MNPERRRFVLALAALPVELGLARVAAGAETPPRKPRVLDAPIVLRSGQRLENLDLTAAAAGPYELMAFPLRFVGADASPVRAVLRTLM